MTPTDYSELISRLEVQIEIGLLEMENPVSFSDCHAAVLALTARVKELEEENGRMQEALTTSAETKAAYICEFRFNETEYGEDEDGEPVERTVSRIVPWTTIKEIMAAIKSRALSGKGV